jgi:hypothetical protein
MRDDPPLAPDWLRIGTDILKPGSPPTTFNATFKLHGTIPQSSPTRLASDLSARGVVAHGLSKSADRHLPAGSPAGAQVQDVAAAQLAGVEALRIESTLATGRDGRRPGFVARG